MTFVALVDSFAQKEDMPVLIDSVIDWIRTNTDHKTIKLYPVGRNKKAFRGACRRVAIPVSGAPVYSADTEIITQILYGDDLPEDWKRLVICKELLHVFDPVGERVTTPDAVAKLIASVVAPEIKGTPFLPFLNDTLGPYRAMAVLIPRASRLKLKAAFENGSRTVSEIASYVRIPEHYVDIWLRHGEAFEGVLCNHS